MQRSAKARLHMRNRGTVSLYWLLIRITKTRILPVMARMLMNQIRTLRISCPMISSHGLNASGTGEQVTSMISLHKS